MIDIAFWCNLPINTAPEKVADHPLQHKGRWYHWLLFFSFGAPMTAVAQTRH